MNNPVEIKINNFSISNNKPFTLIAGPCVLESYEHANFMVKEIKAICNKLNINFIYKTSFDKANRTSIDSERGLGIDKGLDILARIKEENNVPIVTDVHEAFQCERVAAVVDMLQIPAFLSRQTDLIVTAAKTGKAVNIKKGQFLSPFDMDNVAKKFTSLGNNNLLLCERGVCFGYNNLVVDFTSLPIMARTQFPVVFDGTHSVQQPGGLGNKTGGRRDMVEYLCKAAVAIGVAALFLEVHNDPDNAPSDGPNMLHLSNLERLLVKLKQIDKITKN